MIAYEFYLRQDEEDHLIGILPERRKIKERITQESIINWAKIIIGNWPDVDLSRVYFIQVDV